MVLKLGAHLSSAGSMKFNIVFCAVLRACCVCVGGCVANGTIACSVCVNINIVHVFVYYTYIYTQRMHIYAWEINCTGAGAECWFKRWHTCINSNSQHTHTNTINNLLRTIYEWSSNNCSASRMCICEWPLMLPESQNSDVCVCARCVLFANAPCSHS